MPPEPLPWDRKGYAFKEHHRKHDRTAGDASGGPSITSRWREPYHYSHRDFRGPSPRRPPQGHYRQGGGGYYSVNYSPESSGRVFTPSRGDRIWPEDEIFRPSSSSRYSGRSGSGGFGNRDGHGLIRRSPYRDAGEFLRSQHRAGYYLSAPAPRSVAVVVPISPTLQPPLKDQNDKASGGCGDGSGVCGGDGDGLSTGHKLIQHDSPLGSMSSWKSKWGHQSSLGSANKAGGTEAKEVRLEVVVSLGKETPLRSPATSPVLSEDGLPKKKPRLGWGQGLAKYEKQKVDGPLDASSSGAKGSVCETSPTIVGLAGSLSPATPCSATCSTSQGGGAFLAFEVSVEDKMSVKTLHNEQATCHSSELTEPGTLNCSEEVPIVLDDFEIGSIAKLTSLLADLLQPEDACSGDSVLPRNSALSKLLVIKESISKELEKTECEIDISETELRSLDNEVGNNSSQSSPKLAVHSASDMCMQASALASNDLALADDTSKDVAVDDIGISRLSPRLNLINSLAGCTEIDTEDIGACSLVDMSEGCKDAVAEQPALCDTGRMGSATKVSAEEDHLGVSYTGSVAGAYRNVGPNLIDLIKSTNLDISRQVLKELNMDCLIDLPKSDIWELDKLSVCRRNEKRVNKKIAKRKRWLKFKEKVLAFKFRALHHLWKEDLRLLSSRKQRQKSNKRVDVNGCSLLLGSQKQRSSLRSRFVLPAGDLALVPTTEMLDFTNKVLSDSEIKLYRQNLKMPALILDDKKRSYAIFISNNSLIEDPVNYEKEREMINLWSQEEKEVFMEKLATFGKDFLKISCFLNHKTTADCIEFYYKNHKSESFEEVKKSLNLRKHQCALPANTYLVTYGRKWTVEANAASLEVYGAASVVAAQNHGITKTQKHFGNTIRSASSDRKVSYGSCDYLEKTIGLDFSDNDREAVAADVLAGICGSISSEAMSYCITSSFDLPEKMKLMSADRSLTAEVTQSLDEDICSDEECGETESTAWTDEEKSLLIRALSLFGKDFDAIAACVRTRTREQCKIFFSKARKCLGLDSIHHDNGTVGVPLSETNGGRSDTDDACGGEMDSAICSTPSCSKLETDLSQSAANNNEGTACHGSPMLNVENDKSNEQHTGGFIVKDDQKVGREVPFFDDDNLICQGSNSFLVMPSKERKDYGQASSENLICAGVADSVQTKIVPVGSGLNVKPLEPVAAGFLEVESKPVVASSTQLEGTCGNNATVALKKDVKTKMLPVDDSGLVNWQQAIIGFSGSNGSSFCFEFESSTDGSTLVQGNKASSLHARVGLLPNQRKAPQDPCSILPSKQQSFLSIQETAHSLPLCSFVQDSSSINFGGQLDVTSKSTLNSEEHGNKQHQNLLNKEFYQLKSNAPLSQVGKQFQSVRGYPPQMLNQHETKGEGDPVTEHSVLSETYLKKNGFPQSEGFFLSASHGSNGNNSVVLSHSVASTICSSRSENQSDSQTHSSVHTSDARTSDVKLFGKILTHPSSVPKSSSSMHDNESKPPSPKVARSLLSSDTGKDDLFACRPGGGSHTLREELPISFGFWDGNRIQTGLPTLPESAVTMAKYPTSLTGLSFYSQKDGLGSNVVLADYQQSCLQNLSSDGKKVDNFTELHKLNRRDMFSEFPQQRRMTHLSTNMIVGEILCGSEVVSDPVKALKLHHAARAKVEVNSWRTDIR